MNPRSLANLKRGGSPGRPAGVPNKASQEARGICKLLVDDPEYRTALRERLIAGRAGALEPLVWQYAYGKPIGGDDDQQEVDGGILMQLIATMRPELRDGVIEAWKVLTAPPIVQRSDDEADED
jgi:hypothetical protein